jgi:hypothetical protein
MEGYKEAPSNEESPTLDSPLDESKYEIQDSKVTTKTAGQSKMQQESTQKLEKKEDSIYIDPSKK